MNNQIVLSCLNLEKSFHDATIEVDVLQGVNLEIMRGDRIAIVGSSGSGKSTLLHLLGGLDVPSKGEIRILDNEFSSLSETERGQLRNRSMGFVYQFHHLLPEFTALENVALPLLIRDNNVELAGDAAAELLTRVGLGNRLLHKPGEMSGGERQRAAIARALVTQPQCILADEPTGNLDEHTAAQVFNIMLELNQDYGTSLIMVTHNLALARKMDKIYELHEGKLNLYQG
ncbi:MAG: lipoprotein releasing system, ATP-binding protein [Gammaproteobacteria bacterium RIFCSPLOWO2_02_47_7]|nr:MAG: lipoprotein releasing system, ATP-binding protein [Gammaproteobacteria bacterium RIFCSPLOWO2_02_47_7]